MNDDTDKSQTTVIGTLDADGSATAIAIARWAIGRGDDTRSAAVQGIDGVYGFTCEYSYQPKQHVAEYDQLEAFLEGREW